LSLFQRAASERGQALCELVFIQRRTDVDSYTGTEHRSLVFAQRHSFWRGHAGPTAQTGRRIRFSRCRSEIRRTPGRGAKMDLEHLGNQAEVKLEEFKPFKLFNVFKPSDPIRIRQFERL